MKLDRKKTKLLKQTKDDNPYIEGTAEERLACVWESWSLMDKNCVEQRLQRHITKLIRK